MTNTARANFPAETLPFNTVRIPHTNGLAVWLRTGFFGVADCPVPEESEREIHSPVLWPVSSSSS